MKSTNITIKLSPELKKEFMEFCQKNSLNASDLIRKFIEEKIKK